jgi:hypothetical protein
MLLVPAHHYCVLTLRRNVAHRRPHPTSGVVNAPILRRAYEKFCPRSAWQRKQIENVHFPVGHHYDLA